MPDADRAVSVSENSAPSPTLEDKFFAEGFQGTPEEIERQWFEHIYRGRGDSMAQLTWRAVLMGSVLGGVLALTNLYVGLKAGWGFGVAITACILSFSIWSFLRKIGLARTQMTILENNCMQSTASAAGYSTGTTLVSAFSAYILIHGEPLPLGLTLAWVFLMAVLGVTLAIPMKRQMVNVEQLRFPTGMAAAETLRALYATGERGVRAAISLGVAGVLAAISAFLTDGLRLISKGLDSWSIGALTAKCSSVVLGPVWLARTVTFVWDPIFIAAGALTGIRVAASMVVAGTLCWAVYVPILQQKGLTSEFAATGIKDPGALTTQLQNPTNAVGRHIWDRLSVPTQEALRDASNNGNHAAAAALLAADLDQLLHGPLLYDAERFAGVTLSAETHRLLAGNSDGANRVRLNRLLLDDVWPEEIGRSTGFKGLLQWTLWAGVSCMVSAGVLSFLMQWRTSLRAFRSLGRMFRRGSGAADPLEAIEAPMAWFVTGQVVCLVALAFLAKAYFDIPYWIALLALVLSFALALVACRVTGETDTTPTGAMGHITQLTIGTLHPGSATTTLMSANVVSGSALSSADLLTDLRSGYLLGANPRKQFLAQFAGIFTGTVAAVLAFRVLVPNAGALSSDQFPAPAAQSWRAVATAMSQGIDVLHPLKRWSILGGALVGIALVLLPMVFPRQQKYLPSAAGVGLAWTFHWFYGFLFFLGGLAGWVVARKWPEPAKDYTFPVASGIIAGGSLMGVLLIFYEQGPEIIRKLLGN